MCLSARDAAAAASGTSARPGRARRRSGWEPADHKIDRRGSFHGVPPHRRKTRQCCDRGVCTGERHQSTLRWCGRAHVVCSVAPPGPPCDASYAARAPRAQHEIRPVTRCTHQLKAPARAGSLQGEVRFVCRGMTGGGKPLQDPVLHCGRCRPVFNFAAPRAALGTPPRATHNPTLSPQRITGGYWAFQLCP